MQASHDFAEIRKHGTGKSSVLAEHFIVSFKQGEITPERALQLGQEICEQFLKGEYQYFMTCHIDKEHCHLHCVFNNTNCKDGKTFETHENRRTTKQDRSFQKLMNITDEVCRQHHLSVIEHPEMGKGKNHWEWDMSRQGIKVRQITPKAEENKFVRDAIDRGNMKVASIAKNIITAYGVEPNQVRGAAMAAFI